MTSAAEVERAERIGRTRARLFALQAVVFIAWQALFFLGRDEGSVETAGLVKVSAWLIWAVLLLALIATGGGLLRGAAVRRLLNDELTRAHRARSHAAGFWAGATASVVLYLLAQIGAVNGREAIHIILSAAIGAALLTFALLERRSRALSTE
jgi:hypothetical protein